MNRSSDQSPEGRGSLNGFYSYKNTFDKDSVWLDVPKHGKTPRDSIVLDKLWMFWTDAYHTPLQ
jgi:hypothetical protein